MKDGGAGQERVGACVYGIIPAAGRSARMGRPKQLLEFGDSTILETVIETLLASGLDGLVVVTTAGIDGALRLSQRGRHLVVQVDDAAGEMIDSIMLGADALAACHDLRAEDGLLVCPGDLAALSGALAETCAAEYRANPQSIVVGAFGARVGHPIVVPFALRGELDGLRGTGLRRILTIHPERVRRVQAPSRECLADVDTPADYERLGGRGGG